MRRILHLDMDAFFASVEQRDDPSLRGRPVAVGGSPQHRGVVAAASYEARAFGVHSAQPMSQALRQCPSLVVVAPQFSKYRSIAQQLLTLYRSVTPLVEPLSLDEAYLDVTDNAWNEPLGVTVARRLKSTIRDMTGLTASAGVAPNKFLAKIASGWRKPDGMTVVAPSRVDIFLRGLPVDVLWGVGPVTAGRLRTVGITHVTDLRVADPGLLRQTFGSFADTLRRLAHGIDDRPVVTQREPRSSGSERTFPTDVRDLDTLRALVVELTHKAATWLDGRDFDARTLVLKLRYSDFHTVTRSHTGVPVRDPDVLTGQALSLLHRTDAGRRPVRLLGVSVRNFVPLGATTRPGQTPLPLATPKS